MQTLLIVTVLAVAMGASGVAATINARYAAQDLGQKIVAQAAARVDAHLADALANARGASEVAHDLMNGVLSPDDHEVVTDYFLKVMRANEGLSYMSFGMRSGKYYHVYRDAQNELSVLWLQPREAGERSLLEWKAGPQGTREVVRDLATSTRTPPYERPYYARAEAVGAPTWTDTYVFLGAGEDLDIPGVTRATPVYDDQGLLGVLTADFDLLALSHNLANAPVGDHGFAFVIELRQDGTRRVIAHPRSADDDAATRLALTRAKADGPGREALTATEVADPAVKALVASLPTNIDAEALISVDLPAEGERYVGAYRLLQGDDAPRWLVCVLIPESELFAGVHRTQTWTMGVAVAGLIVAMLLALRLSSRVAAPLQQVADETRAIAEFQLASAAPVSSSISELAQLGIAMEEMKAGLRSFRKYVPADLVRAIVRTGQEAQLGGTRREITLYFSDIAGFTSIAEQLEPEQLVELLSEYLGTMSAEMLEAGGTVDKYIGDAIMAFWGAPTETPEHAAIACRTALANQQTLARLRERWSADGLPPISARIGLHTGDAIVGNFGSEHRLDYTAIGDSVNLASRLEGINKTYGTEIILSASTHERVGDEFACRPLDKVAVRGRTEGIVIYELVGRREDLSEHSLSQIALYSRGFEAYLSRDWAAAKGAFEAYLNECPSDKAARLLLERTTALESDPPHADWSGVYRPADNG